MLEALGEGEAFSYWILTERDASLQVRRCTLRGLDVMILSLKGSASNRNNLNFETTSEFRTKMKGNQENLHLDRRVAKTSRLLASRLASKWYRSPKDVCLFVFTDDAVLDDNIESS